MILKDHTGERFGHLIALERDTSATKNVRWICKCDCGNIKSIEARKLTGGDVTSCGCMHYKWGHGMSDTRLYHIWCTMKARCLVPTSHKYARYGGRGITICDEWANDFMTFYNWAINNGYREDLSIDRIDNNCGYYPSNCRWATLEEQANNTSTNRFVDVYGERMTVAEAARKYGMPPRLIYKRLWMGWPPEEAVSTRAHERRSTGR